MKKQLSKILSIQVMLIAFLFMTSLITFAQAPWQVAYGNNSFQLRTEWYSPVPTNMANNRNVLGYLVHTTANDSTHVSWKVNIWTFSKYKNTRNDGLVPVNMLFTDTGGTIRSAQWANLTMNQSQIVGLTSSLNGKMSIPSGANGQLLRYNGSAWIAFTPNYLTSYTETDPVWLADKSSYYTKTQSDARYLQSFTETDPTVPAYAKELTGFAAIKSSTDALYQPIGSYLTTEVDPTVGAHIKAITTTNISNWNTAFGWGNHATAGYLLSSTAATTYQPLLGFTPVSNTRNLTINGVTQDLSNDRTFTITNITGNAGTATTLQTARTINGQSFNGSANITIPGSAVTGIPNASLTNSSITINGQSVSLGGSTTVTASPSISAPSAGNALTMGTAFQPNSSAPSMVTVTASLTGLVGLLETVTVSMSPTQSGTYTDVASDVLLIGVLGQTLSRSLATIPVPAGYWVKVTRSGSAATATYTRWNF